MDTHGDGDGGGGGDDDGEVAIKPKKQTNEPSENNTANTTKAFELALAACALTGREGKRAHPGWCCGRGRPPQPSALLSSYRILRIKPHARFDGTRSRPRPRMHATEVSQRPQPVYFSCTFGGWLTCPGALPLVASFPPPPEAVPAGASAQDGNDDDDAGPEVLWAGSSVARRFLSTGNH